MKLARFAFRSINTNLSHESYRFNVIRSLSTNPFPGNANKSNRNDNESADDFERRIFGGGHGNSSDSGSFFRKLDRLENKNMRGAWGNMNGAEKDSSVLEDIYEDQDVDVRTTLSDGMQGQLRKAATNFEFDAVEDVDKKKTGYFGVDLDEVDKEDFAFRPDVSFKQGMTYELKDLDLKKPGVRKTRRSGLEVTTKQVLEEADFRNVKFLAQFITESGIIFKRSMSGISAKAQRKVAREIKTARAFGLMPFTTMGTKSFTFGKTMEDLDEDYQYRNYINNRPDRFDTKKPFGM